MPSGFGGRSGSEVSMGQVLLWDVLAAITLVGGRARARARCEPGFLLYSVAINHPIRGKANCQGIGAEVVMIQSELVPFPLSVHFPSSNSTFAPVESSTGARGATAQ